MLKLVGFADRLKSGFVTWTVRVVVCCFPSAPVPVITIEVVPELAVEGTVTVTCVGEYGDVTGFVEKLAQEFVDESVIAWLYPRIGVSVTVADPVEPALTVSVLGDTEIAKLGLGAAPKTAPIGLPMPVQRS